MRLWGCWDALMILVCRRMSLFLQLETCSRDSRCGQQCSMAIELPVEELCLSPGCSSYQRHRRISGSSKIFDVAGGRAQNHPHCSLLRVDSQFLLSSRIRKPPSSLSSLTPAIADILPLKSSSGLAATWHPTASSTLLDVGRGIESLVHHRPSFTDM
jgi:hypothetical protein